MKLERNSKQLGKCFFFVFFKYSFLFSIINIINVRNRFKLFILLNDLRVPLILSETALLRWHVEA